MGIGPYWYAYNVNEIIKHGIKYRQLLVQRCMSLIGSRWIRDEKGLP